MAAKINAFGKTYYSAENMLSQVDMKFCMNIFDVDIKEISKSIIE